MKLMVIGFGQCGGRIADEFARLNKLARGSRGVDIITGAVAVDTETAALAGLHSIKPEPQQQIVIGEAKLRGRGTGKQSELAAQIASEEGFKIVDAIRETKRFSETDAFLLVAGAAGGFGAGALPIVVKLMKERYADKPVYSLVVLPFEHEETMEERIIYNTASCLKSVYPAADAVFLVDNQKHVRKGLSLSSNVDQINRLIVEPFYNLLCAGEQEKRKQVTLNILDAGEIVQALSGWTAIGYGKALLNLITFPWDKSRSIKKTTRQVQKGIQATDEALNELSVQCNPRDATKALFLVSAPVEEIEIDLVKNFGDHLRTIAPDAPIRYGDYPVNKGLIDITVILSGLKEVPKVTSYYSRYEAIAKEIERKKLVSAATP